jgi:hypothetical protein
MRLTTAKQHVTTAKERLTTEILHVTEHQCA